MTWTSLVAPKGTAGSVAGWVNYTKLDIPTIVYEAQSLLFSMLRVREMRAEWVFGMAESYSNAPLPARFLDPIGPLFDITNNIDYGHSLETDILKLRSYDSSPSGSLGADPFSTLINSSTAFVHLVGHGLTQGSTITIAGADDVAGVSFNGTFPVISMPAVGTADFLIIDTDTLASANGAGGGSLATYTANKLISGSPSRWSIWNERLMFDTAFDTATTFKQLYYRAPLPLSATNLSNWLTNRYPMLMRKACQAAAADFMKDDVEYKKCLEALQGLIQSTAAESDLSYRGAEFGTDTP